MQPDAEPDMGPGAVDHLVLPVHDLGTARIRLSKLGFSVAPDARHPFGTENACIFLSDGTYLEPLAIADTDSYRTSANSGNIFTSRDRAFRERNGPEGFSALVAKTEDATGDHARFCSAGFSAGEMLEFSRPLLMPDGSSSQSSFRLAFAADAHSPDFLLFSCQRITALPADRGALERHGNGVTGIREIVLGAEDPLQSAALLSAVLRVEGERLNDGTLAFKTANAIVKILPPASQNGRLFLDTYPQTKGLRGLAVVYRVTDLAVTEALLAANGVTFIRKDCRLVVSAAEGQGTLFAFEE
jgi:hypothetical protein